MDLGDAAQAVAMVCYPPSYSYFILMRPTKRRKSRASFTNIVTLKGHALY